MYARAPGVMTELVAHGPRVWDWENPGRVKPMTSRIDTCHILARHLALLGSGKDWLAQSQDNVTEWNIKAWCWWPSLPVGQHYKNHNEGALSQVGWYLSWYDRRCY